ncbi:MAG: CRTAC1 family protein [Gemmatimonadaceae bacterium]
MHLLSLTPHRAVAVVACSMVAAGAWLATPPSFTPVQPELFAAGGSFTNAWADVDGDGDEDLFVGFNGIPNRLYRNDRGTFVDIGAAAGVADARATRAAAWGDFDTDGDPDLLVGFTPGAGGVLRLYRNDGAHFSDVTEAAALRIDSGAVRQPAWIDFDGDGDLDLYIAFRDRPNALFRNDGGRFANVAAAAGLADTRKSVGGVWFDADEDGDLDLYQGNMDGDANALWINQGGHFTDEAASHGLAWGGREPNDPKSGTVRTCVADVNGDGRLDIFAANYGPNGLFLNRGKGRYEDVSAAWGIALESHDDACAFADFDNDGLVDLYVNGTVTGGVSYRDFLFRNTGSRFDDVTPANVLERKADHGVQWNDYDRDGDEDLALTGVQPDGMHSLLRNDLRASDAARSLAVRVTDGKGRATRAGAVVTLYPAGSRQALGARLVDAGSGYDAQSDAPVHFGVGAVTTVDVVVTFPSAGKPMQATRRGIRIAAYAGRVLDVRVP